MRWIRARLARHHRSADNLAEKAKSKNLDGATLAYLDMTRSCVACHSHFRNRKRD